ncbi:MAG: IS200/IS605 family transposase [Planctomycetota bacterium]
MASTHQQLLYHIVFSTKNRRPLLTDAQLRDNVFAYMAGIARNLGGYALEIGGWIDHAHLLLRIPARNSVSDFMGQLKANTSKYINETKSAGRRFSWQEGFGAFSVSPSQKSAVARYIRGQAEHHAKATFEDEYVQLLERHGVEYDPRFVMD